MTSVNKGTIRLYGAGGAGINCISVFNDVKPLQGCANILTSYIDTSRSNLKHDFREEDCFIFKDKDGSGKIRKENHKDISDSIKKILLEQKPGDFNIVVSSASGGSGSVIAPLLVAELLRRGDNVIYCLIGSAECTITATNTLNTLKSLDSIADNLDIPVIVYYQQNDHETPRSQIDKNVRYAIACISNLVSKENTGLDTMDISNWVRFTYSTGIESQLGLLDIFTDIESPNDVTDPIAIASLYNDPDQPKIKVVPEYSCVGYFPTPTEGYDQLHFVISTDNIKSIYSNIDDVVKRYKERRESRKNKTSLVESGDFITNDNLIL